MPYTLDIELIPLTQAERKAMDKLFDEIMEIIARTGQRT